MSLVAYGYGTDTFSSYESSTGALIFFLIASNINTQYGQK